jgi:DNA-binding SARP family transcriptional activator
MVGDVSEAGSGSRRPLIRVLGPIELGDAQQSAHADSLSPRQRLAIALIVAAGPAGVSTDELQEALWGHEGADDTGAVRTLMTRLRAVLPAGVAIRSLERRRYVLEAADGLVDAAVFDHQAKAPQQLSVEQLQAALGLWRSSVAFEGTEWPTIHAERRRLAMVRRDALLVLLDRLNTGGHPPSPWLLTALLSQFDIDATDEPVALGTSLALAASGRRVEALRVLERNRRALVDVGLDQGLAARRFGEELVHNPSTPPGSTLPGLISSVAQPIRGIQTIRRPALETAVVSGLRRGPVAIVGPAGAGKSVLCDHVEALLRNSPGGMVFRIAAPPDPASVMQPIVELLASLEASCPLWAKTVQADVAQQSVWSRVTGTPTTLMLERHTFLDHLADLVADGLSQVPSCLLLDDHHHLDPNSRELIARLARRSDVGSAFQLLCSSRHELEGDVSWETVRTVPFSAAEVSAALQPLLNDNAIDPAQIVAITRWTGGSPLFLTLIADHVRDEGSTGALPESVQRAVLDRLFGHSAKTRSVLEFAAVQGQTCRLSVMQRILGPIDESVAEATNDGLITVDSHSLSFVHELVSEAIARSIAPGRAVAMHDEICAAMVAEGEQPVAAAVHGLRSATMDPLRALSLCLAAAEEESNVLSWPSVVDWTNHGLSLVQMSGDRADDDFRPEDPMSELVGRLLFQRGRARRYLAGAGSEADLIGAAERLRHDTESFVVAVVELCRHGASNRQDDFDELRIQLLHDAMSSAVASHHRVALKGAAPSVLMLRPEDRWGRSVFLEALDECGSITAPSVRRDVLTNALTGLQDPEDLPRYDQALLGLAEFDDPSSSWESRVIEFTRALRLGDRSSLDDAYAQLQSQRSGVPRETARSFLRVEIAMLHLRNQQHDAWSQCTRMPGARVEGTTVGERAVFVAAAAPVLLTGHRFSELRAHFESLRSDMPWASCWGILLQLCDIHDGVCPAQPLAIPVEEVRRDLTWMAAMGALAHIAFVVQDRQLALAVREALSPHLNEMVWTGVTVMYPVADAYALCSRVVDDDEAVARFTSVADDLSNRLGAPHLRLRCP